MRLLVAGGACPHLRLEALSLILRVVELGEGVRDLPAIDVGLEPLDEPRIGAVHLGQGRNVARKSGDMDRLDQRVLDARGKSRLERLPPILAAGQCGGEPASRLTRRLGRFEGEEIDPGRRQDQLGHAAPGPWRGDIDVGPSITDPQRP